MARSQSPRHDLPSYKIDFVYHEHFILPATIKMLVKFVTKCDFVAVAGLCLQLGKPENIVHGLTKPHRCEM